MSRPAAKNEMELVRRKKKVYALVPQIKELHNELGRLLTDRLRLAISGESADEKKIASLRSKEKQLLASAGFDAAYLDPAFTCAECQDTGLLPDATHCACFKKKLLEDKLDTARLTDNDTSFELYRLDIFDDAPLENGRSQRDAMQKCKIITERYADSFPDCAAVLVLSGGIGLGKTFVSKCIMRRVIERGHTAALYTAYRLVSLFHAHRLGEDVDLDPLFDVPLLIIDDLGTEPMTKNVTVEYF